jgi:hypothetical protein
MRRNLNGFVIRGGGGGGGGWLDGSDEFLGGEDEAVAYWTPMLNFFCFRLMQLLDDKIERIHRWFYSPGRIVVSTTEDRLASQMITEQWV